MATQRTRDEYFMKEAIKEQKKAQGPKRFGAVVVCNGKIVGRGHNTTYETGLPVSCAETNAILQAAKKLKARKFKNCTIYETGESCLVCAGAIMSTQIKRVVVGFSHADYNKLDGRKKMNPWAKHLKSIMPKDTKIVMGVLRKECIAELFNPISS